MKNAQIALVAAALMGAAGAAAGWLTAEWGRSETNRKAKFYEPTPAGRRHAEAEARNWKRVSVAIELALRDVGEA